MAADSQSHPFTLRGFLDQVAVDDPAGVLRISEPVDLDYDITAIALALEAEGRAPVLWFENVRGSAFPIVTNLFGTRRRYALALGVPERELIRTWGSRGDQMIAPILRETGPVHDVIATGAEIDLARLPIMRHFTCDGGPYITNGIIVAKDPDTGVRNASFQRLQVTGRNRLGTSLHSRRHLWDYVRRAEERDTPIPIAIVIGAHPSFTYGALWKGPIGADEYAVIGGLRGQPMEITAGLTVPIEAPLDAEIVLEGHILPHAREPEGPFAEFTGYASERSTQQVIEISAILHRRDAIYQDIVAGMSDEHTSLLGIPQEARLLRTLHQHLPNVLDVAYPKSGTCKLHAYISMRNPVVGQPKHAAAIALGDDLGLKLVVIVDADVNVHDDREVLWAIATRMQADQDIDVIQHSFGAILDPSNDNGLTAKMIIDATRPSGFFPARHELTPEAQERARNIIEILKGKNVLF